jgi:hypothetical protein
MSPQHHIGQDVKAVEFGQQVDESGAVWFDKVPAGHLIRFSTKHSLYEYDPHAKRIRGGFVGNDWVDGEIAGATFGGSMLAPDRLIPGALAEMYPNGQMVTTSPLLTLEVVPE